MPKYAPELNDIERCWRDLKQHQLANRTPAFTGAGSSPMPTLSPAPSLTPRPSQPRATTQIIAHSQAGCLVRQGKRFDLSLNDLRMPGGGGSAKLSIDTGLY